MIKRWAGNLLWIAGSARAHREYARARRDPRLVQERILHRFLRRNTGSEYGRRHGYGKIRTVREFQDAVPVVRYEDLEPWIERIRNGRPNVLTAEPVLMMEKTSGSSSAAKYIPYTPSLRSEFQNAIGAWMFDLFTRRRALLGGTHYWSISPMAREKERTPGGLPVGFEDDSDYLSPFERTLASWVMAVPAALGRIADLEESRRETVRHLMRDRHLRFISVWNPSFLSILMRRLPRGVRPVDLWPELGLISCWTSGPSARFVPELQELFPGIEIQGKGLLATEGVVTFPELGRPAPSPAITSHFLEFLGEDRRYRLVDELEVGCRYSVVMTTGGGFARYALGDQVEVVAPGALQFVGRSDGTSDVCGEKLSESFVGPILEETSAKLSLTGLLMLAPEWGTPPRYELFLESEDILAAAALVESLLRRSVHYDYCRKLGQLGPVQGVRVTAGGHRYLEACEKLGQRVGNIKPAYLRREFGWRDRLAARHAS